MTVQQAFAAVMADVQAVAKTGHNSQQNYSFRGIDSVMNAVGPALREHGVVIIPTLEDATYRDIEVGQKRTLMREITVRVRYTIHGPDGDTMEGVAPGESMDSGDKGTAKAMSVAYRTFLLQALTIPTNDPDPDEHSYERAPRDVPARVGPLVGGVDDLKPAELNEQLGLRGLKQGGTLDEMRARLAEAVAAPPKNADGLGQDESGSPQPEPDSSELFEGASA